MKAKIIAATCLIAMTCMAFEREKASVYEFKDFKLAWNVAQSGKTTVKIVKTQDFTYVDLRGLMLSGEDARDIASAMRRLVVVAEAMRKAGNDDRKDETFGKAKATFLWTKRGGFVGRIEIEKKKVSEQFTEKEASDLADVLADANDLINEVDSKMKFTEKKLRLR